MFDVEQVKQLNDLERIVYEYIVKHPDKVKYMRIRELSSETHVCLLYTSIAFRQFFSAFFRRIADSGSGTLITIRS